MKRRAKRNAPRSEKAAWLMVKEIANDVAKMARGSASRIDAGKLAMAADDLIAEADTMLAQLKSGLHENSPLTVFSLANPPRGAKLMSDHLFTIEYKHKANRKNYFHDFKPGTMMHAMPDGSIRISRPGARVWGEFDAE